MRITYPYNEILPTRKAHDAYVWRNCVSLAETGAEVALACGAPSLADDALARHYATALPVNFSVARLAILRRNWGLPFTWNRVFDTAAQRLLADARPDVAIVSVRKQGRYHFARKLPGVRYVYEVHELAWYPTFGPARDGEAAIAAERDMLARADLVTVTTGALRDILTAAPYRLANRIEVVPLAISTQPSVPDATHGEPLHVMYIGQLYAGQGVEDLLEAVARVNGVTATIVGGTPAEIAGLRAALPAEALERVRFTGFVPPAGIPALAAGAHAFAAPFRNERRMPFVAHTKLAEYAALRRPVVAPDLPIVHEHFPQGGVRTYRPNDVSSLAAALSSLRDTGRWTECMSALASARITRWADRARDYREVLESVTKHTANQ